MSRIPGRCAACFCVVLAAAALAQSPPLSEGAGGPGIRGIEVPDAEKGPDVLNRVVELGDERWLSLAQAVEAIGTAASTPIRVHWRLIREAGAERDKPVLTPSYAAPLPEALQDVFDQTGKCGVAIHCEIRAGVVHVIPREFADRAPVIRVYDVRPLLDRFEAWQRAGEERHARHLQRLCTLCPPLRYWRNPGKLGMDRERLCCFGRHLEEPVATPSTAVAELTDLIEQTVAPDYWCRNGGAGLCECIAGRLIVRQPACVQAQVAAFLETLAASLEAPPAATPEPRRESAEDATDAVRKP